MILLALCACPAQVMVSLTRAMIAIQYSKHYTAWGSKVVNDKGSNIVGEAGEGHDPGDDLEEIRKSWQSQQPRLRLTCLQASLNTKNR